MFCKILNIIKDIENSTVKLIALVKFRPRVNKKARAVHASLFCRPHLLYTTVTRASTLFAFVCLCEFDEIKDLWSVLIISGVSKNHFVALEF